MARIGWDLDGIVYKFKEANCNFEVMRGNVHRSLENCSPLWHYYTGWGDLTTPEWLVTYAEGVDAGHILWKGEPYKDAIDVARQMRFDGHTIHIVTDRSVGKAPQMATRTWLEDVNFEYDTIDFSPNKSVVQTDFFIEDKLENYDALTTAGTKCYLQNRSWNAPSNDNRLRVDTLWEFYKKVSF